MENKKKKFKIYLIIIGILVLIGFNLLFILFWNELAIVLNQVEGAWFAVISGVIRIIILVIMSSILYSKWFKQERIYVSDAYFLFALFFSILIVGKMYDLYINLITFSEGVTADFVLLITKIRYFIITLNLMPILYIGLETTLALISAYVKNVTKSQFNKIRLGIIGFYLMIVLFIIIFAPNLNSLIIALPYFTLGIYLVIAIMFFFMYKNKRLSQANALLIGIAFLCLIASSLIRSVITVIALEIPSIFVIAELLDIIVNFIIFLGFITRANYAKL
ncbi:MAG: hypothetical protein ACFFFB_11920 [Candidatus Heimdallarchaeota archaeon]